MSDSKEQLQRLEEKLSKAIEIFKRTQAEKRALLEDLERARQESKERAKQAETLEREVIALRKEREDVRTRVEKLLERIDVLTTPDSEG